MELPLKIKEWIGIIRFLPIHYILITLGVILTPLDQSIVPAIETRLTHLLLTAGVVLLLLSELSWRIKKTYYRMLYPIQKLNKKFHIVNIGGTVFIYDNLTGNYRWVENYTTYLDLGFHGYCENVDKPELSNPLIPRAEQIILNHSRNVFLLKNYRPGSGIRTRGNPND